MKVLLITKQTNQEILDSQIKALRIRDPEFLERLRSSHEEHLESLESLRQVLKSSGIDVIELKRGAPWPDTSDLDCVITLGGDGTILFSSHHLSYSDVPLLGVRSSSESVGHLCALNEKNISLLPEKLSRTKEETVLVERLSAQVDFQSGGQLITAPILNDFLFSNKNPALTTRYGISLGDEKEDHKSSGVWISTAAGSTAAIGTLDVPAQGILDKEFQFKVRELYPHPSQFKLSGRLFNPDKESLSIYNYNKKAILAIDGRHGCVDLTLGDKITFKRAHPLKIFGNKRLSS